MLVPGSEAAGTGLLPSGLKQSGFLEDVVSRTTWAALSSNQSYVTFNRLLQLILSHSPLSFRHCLLSLISSSQPPCPPPPLSLRAPSQTSVHNQTSRGMPAFPGSSSLSLCAMARPAVFHQSQVHVGSCRLSSSSCVCVFSLCPATCVELSHSLYALHPGNSLITKCVCSVMCAVEGPPH